MDLRREVVVTGWGVVSPIGIGRTAYVESLRAGRSGVRALPHLQATEFPVPIGADVPDFDGKKFVQPRKSLKVMCREVQFGYSAAALALQDARIESGQIPSERLGCVFGSEMFYVETDELEPAYRACMQSGPFDFARWGTDGYSKLYPLWMLKYLPNMVACHLAIAFDGRGPNNTIAQGEVSALLALIEAARVIARGHADVMVAGGVGNRLSLTPLMYRRDSRLSHRCSEPQRASRPFDRDRDGMVNGEGAGAMVLESREHAEGRGAPILARLTGWADRFGSPVAPNHLDGPAIQATISSALLAARLDASQVGHVQAAGFGTVEGDMREARAIRAILGDVPVTAPKSFFGNTGAASASVEWGASLHALESGEIPVTLNYDQPDTRCPIRVVGGASIRSQRRTAVLLSQSTTGQAAAVVLDAS